MFNPDMAEELLSCDWNFDANNGPRRSYLSAVALKDRFKNGEVYKIVKITFSDSDFQGDYIHNPSILFQECHFDGCDFSFSNWTRTTFRDCNFTNCSLALASFKECEFRDCKWDRIGFSGHKTELLRTVITNPEKLVQAGFSGICINKKDNKEHVSYQSFRLETTKANLARGLLISHESVGDDQTYYDTARLHDLQQAKAKIYENWHIAYFGEKKKQSLKFTKKQRFSSALSCLMWLGEYRLLQTVGFINGWGVSLLRPLVGLLIVTIAFSIIYGLHATSPTSGGGDPLQLSFDIGTIAGYSNAEAPLRAEHLTVWGDAQLVVSIFLYTIFFSTAVARFSRAR